MTIKIFIGNLSGDTKPEDVRVLFEKYGEVAECDVLKNYGFVHMENMKEANTAIANLNGYNIKGQRMRVELSTGKEGNPKGDRRGNMTIKIFIGNLSGDTKPEDVRVLFEKYGEVAECDVLKNYGFVHMENMKEANTAIANLNGYNIKGQRMRVELSTGKEGNPKGDRRGNMTIKIFIGNLSGDTKPEDVRVLFEKYGEVAECDVLKNYGFVHMENMKEANTAIANLNGYNIKGQRMRVELSTGKEGNPKGDRRGPPERGGFRSRPYPPGPPRSRGGMPPMLDYDRFDPYYPYPERDPFYRLPPVDRYLPSRLPPPGDRYAPLPRERLMPEERGLYPPPPDPRGRLMARDRLPPYPEERAAYGRRREPPWRMTPTTGRGLPFRPGHRPSTMTGSLL
ncbi:RNA-binding protein lark-like isoform X2 [Littorina saxatilis]